MIKLSHLPIGLPKHVAAVLLGALFLAASLTAQAQPSLTFKRVTVNWPTIELYFTIGCNGEPSYNMSKRDFRIFENNEEIRDFTIWCPDPHIRCAASLGIVMDVSGSMRGEPMTSAKEDATTLIDACDNLLDEVTVIRAADRPYVALPMTSWIPLLRASIDSCSPSGATALYDGMYMALEELIKHGVNQCRAILVFTDGGDVASDRTANEVIALANRNRLRIFTFGYGEYGPKAELEVIAQLTGGRYYNNPTQGEMVGIYQDITYIMFQGFQECIITYERECADGSLRTVDMGIQDFCEGADSKTKTYRAPLDSSTLKILNVEIPTTQIERLQAANVPVMFDGPFEMLQPFELTVRYDSVITFLGAEAAPGSLLYGVEHNITQRPGAVIVRSMEPLSIGGQQKLLDLRFRAASIADTITSAILIESMIIPTGCLLPVIHNNPVIVGPHMLPFITASAYDFCSGESVTLQAVSGFARYLWSTGDTAQNIRVWQGGTYTLQVVDHSGDTLHAAPVTVAMHSLPRVRIAADGPLEFCRGKNVKLSLSGDTAGISIRWSKQALKSRTITITEANKYWATVVSPFGCSANSDTVEVSVTELPVRVLPGYDIDLCQGESVVLSVEGEYQNVRWGHQTGKTCTIVWSGLYGSTWIRAEVTDSSGCKGLSDTVRITMRRAARPSVTPSGTLELCTGGVVVLTADSGHVSYEWSTGDTTRSIAVSQPGAYTVEVANEYGCRARTDTVFVVQTSSPRPNIAVQAAPLLCGSDTLLLDGGANYISWRWSTGATTRHILVADSGAYWVEVTAFGGCSGISDTLFVNEDEVQQDFDPAIRGSLPLCPGDTLWLDAPEGMVHWLWNTGIRARSLPVTKPGRYAVTVVTSGGCEVRSAFVDVTMTQSARPVIARTRDILSSSAAQSYQWYFNGQTVAGATQKNLTVVEKGSYTVAVVDEYGCTMTSEPFIVNILGISGAEVPDDLLLYPEPASDWLNIVFPLHSRDARVTLVSLLGQVLARHESSGENSARSMRLDLSALPAGVYLLHANAGEKWWVRKVVKR